MRTETKQCSQHELAKLEAQLRARGYRLSNANSDKELTIREYRRAKHHASATTFTGELVWTVTWRID